MTENDFEGYEVQGDYVGMFDINIAMMLDANCAIVYTEIQYNERHFVNGRYWSVYSVREWKEMMPFLSEKQIRGALIRLEEAGLIDSGNYNRSAWDKTKWYSTNPVPEAERE